MALCCGRVFSQRGLQPLSRHVLPKEQRSEITSDFGRVQGADQYERVSALRINFKATKPKDRTSAAICTAHPIFWGKIHLPERGSGEKGCREEGPFQQRSWWGAAPLGLAPTLGHSLSQLSGKVEKPREADGKRLAGLCRPLLCAC